MKKLIILDRDGVINHDSDDYIKSCDEWISIDDSIESIVKLQHHGYEVAIATNQSGVYRNYFSINTLNDIHEKLQNLIYSKGGKSLSHISFCPHNPDGECRCRKPNIGMLEEISQVLNINLNKDVVFIGDSYKDILAGKKAGITPVLVTTGKGKETLKKYKKELLNIEIFDSLLSFVNKYLGVI